MCRHTRRLRLYQIEHGAGAVHWLGHSGVAPLTADAVRTAVEVGHRSLSVR